MSTFRLLLGLALAAGCAAFTSPHLALNSRHQCAIERRSSGVHLSMVGSEAFQDAADQASSTQKVLRKVPGSVTKVGLATLTGLSAVGGWVGIPSSRLIVNAAGAAAGASLGAAFSKNIGGQRKGATYSALAAMLAVEGVDKLTTDDIQKFKASQGCTDEEMAEHVEGLYKHFLLACLKSGDVEMEELQFLYKLIEVLGVPRASVGNAFCYAAEYVTSYHYAWLLEDEENESKTIRDKLVWLAQRVLSEDESEEGMRYELGRTRKKLELTEDQWADKAETLGLPFYTRALNKAVKNVGRVQPKDLQDVRNSLGVPFSRAEPVHLELYTSTAEEKAAKGTLSAEDQETLKALNTLLELKTEDTQQVMNEKASPAYTALVQEVVETVLKEGSSNSAGLFGKMAMLQQELMMSSEVARTLEQEAIQAQAVKLFTGVTRNVRAGNTKTAVAEMKDMVTFAQNAVDFVKQGRGGGEGDTSALLKKYFTGISRSVEGCNPPATYRAYLVQCLTDLNMTPEDQAELQLLGLMLGMSSQQTAEIYRMAAGPLLKAALSEAVEADDFSAEAKAALEMTVTGINLPEEASTAIALEIYTERLEQCSGDGKIMTTAQRQDVIALADFLGLPQDALDGIHNRVCAAAYTGSLKEVMGTSSYIPDEYWGGLVKLQERLMLTADRAEKLYVEVAQERMKEYVDQIMDELKAKAKKEAGVKPEEGEEGEMNMEADPDVAGEIISLVDYARNIKAIMKVPKEGQEDAEEPEMGEMCRVNVRDLVRESQLSEVYRGNLVEAFSTMDEAANQKLLGNMEPLAAILGLTEGEVASVHKDLGALMLNKYLTKKLIELDGPLQAEDEMFLASVQMALSLNEDFCAQLKRKAEVSRVMTLTEQEFDGASIEMEGVRRLREIAESLEVDIKDDLRLPQWKLETLFRVELEAAILEEEVTVQDQSLVGELCAAFSISEAKAQELLLAVIEAKCQDALLQATAVLARDADEAMKAMDQMVIFAKLNPSEVDSKATQIKKEDLYLMYQAKLVGAATGGDLTDEDRADLDLLKTCLGLNEVV